MSEASHHEDGASEVSILGTCIEIELADDEDDDDWNETRRFPLFKESVLGESVQAVPCEGDVQHKSHGKRKASQRMSITFESIVGAGKNFKRRVSSLWSNNASDRKDSAWISLGAAEREVTAKGAGDEASMQNNPYPSMTGLLARRARAQAQYQDSSGPASPLWSPCTSHARSTDGISDGHELSRQAAREGGKGCSLSARDMGRLTSQPLPPGYPSEMPPEYNSKEDTVFGGKTPKHSKPQGTSMEETGYSLAHHLTQAMELGRFDHDKIDQRFSSRASTEVEPSDSAQEESAEDVPSEDDAIETSRKQPDRSSIEAQDGPQCNSSRIKSISSWRRGRRQSSQPAEPRPSVSGAAKQEQRGNSFGGEFAQIAGVVGTSFQQANTFTL